MCDSLPLQLPTILLQLPIIIFTNTEIKRTNFIKFLGVIIDKNLTWKNHIEVIENEISKKNEFFFRASNSFDFKNLVKI